MKKTKEQEIRDKSEGLLKLFFAGWPFNPLPDDYGLDFLISVKKNDYILEYDFLVQLKGSESLDYKDDFFNFVMKTKHLKSYVKNPTPILVIIYDVITENGYWINIQKYCRNVLDTEDPNWKNQKTKTIKIPLSNQLNNKDIILNEVIQSTKENMMIYVEKLKWPEGFENILDNPERIKEIISKTEIENIKRRIHTSVLYFRSDNIKEMQEQFFEIYKLKRKNTNHLQSILAILTSSNIFEENINTFIFLAQEGIQLSKKLEDQMYPNIFTFLFHYYTTFEILKKQHIPNILMRLETLKKPNQIDEFIKFLWDSKNIVINNQIKEHSKKMLEILDSILKSGELYEFHVLHLHLLQIEIFLNNILKNYIEKDMFSKILEKNEDFIQVLVELSEQFEIVDTRLQTYLVSGGYYEAYKPEKAAEFYRKGLQLAKNINHQYYIKKFNYNLDNMGNNPELYTINKVKKCPYWS